MNKILVENLKHLKSVCKAHYVKKMYAFGSVCTKRFNENSDIDLLVFFQPLDFGEYADNYFSLVNRLEKIFNRRVDLLTDNSLSNPYFINLWKKPKTVLYE